MTAAAGSSAAASAAATKSFATASLISSAGQAVADIFNGMAARELGKMKADLAEFQAWVSQEQTKNLLAVHNRRAAKALGKRVANIASRGFGGGGSAMDIALEQMVANEQEAVKIKIAGVSGQATWQSRATEYNYEADSAYNAGIANSISDASASMVDISIFSARSTKAK